MFPRLPDEMEREIWKAFWSLYILSEIRSREPIWSSPSIQLLYNSSGTGALQHRYTDLERTLFSSKCTWPELREEIYDSCFLGVCHECVTRGFPCNDAISCGGLNRKIEEFWDMSFYKDLLGENEEWHIGAAFI